MYVLIVELFIHITVRPNHLHALALPFVSNIEWFYPYSSSLSNCHRNIRTIALLPAKQSWRMNEYMYHINTLDWVVHPEQDKAWANFMGYTVCSQLPMHYSDVIVSPMTSQITSLAIVYSTVYSGTEQRKHQSSTRDWPLWGELAGERWIPHTKGQ